MPDSNAIKVFFSVGRTSTPQQEEFVGAIEAYMIDRGLAPQALGRNYWSSKQPLSAIDELMGQCSGAAVVGFERLRILQAVDRRGSGAERILNDCTLPTVWNQIEATMAHVRGLPLLVLVEDGLRTEGLLETTNDWYVKRLPLTPAATAEREFAGIFTDWHARVRAHHASIVARRPEPATQPTGSSPSIEAAVEAAPMFNRRQLRMLLDAHFDERKLRVLCFDLNVNTDAERLFGDTNESTTIKVIGYFERTRRITELIDYVKELHPEPWQAEKPRPPTRIVAMSAAQLKELHEALLSAFQSVGQLEQMVRFNMDLHLHEIASGNLSDQAFALIQYCEAQGLLGKLLESAVTANPGNLKLKAMASALGI
jgi:hypothetical protein